MDILGKALELDYIVSQYMYGTIKVISGINSDGIHTEVWCLPQLNKAHPSRSTWFTDDIEVHIDKLIHRGCVVFSARTTEDFYLNHIIYSTHHHPSNKFWDFTKSLYPIDKMNVDIPFGNIDEYVQSTIIGLYNYLLDGKLHVIERLYIELCSRGLPLANVFRIFLENKNLVVPFLIGDDTP